MTQTKLYERFMRVHIELNLGQRSFEKCKTWYVRVNTTHVIVDITLNMVIIITHTHTHFIFCIAPMCRNVHLYCPRHHPYSLFIPFCVLGQKVVHITKKHAYMGHALVVLECHYWASVFMWVMTMNWVGWRLTRRDSSTSDGRKSCRKIQLVSPQVSNECIVKY